MPLHLLIPLWAGQILFGWLIADALTGIVHWLEDRVWREDFPIIGPEVVRPNRLHHRIPLAFTKNTVVARGFWTWLLVGLIAVVWLILTGPNLTLATAAIGGFVVNEVHRWAHEPLKAPRWVQMLQETGAIQSPRHHAGHHRAPSDRRYCILTDWLNPGLDAIDFWNRLEAAMTAAGLEPNRGTA